MTVVVVERAGAVFHYGPITPNEASEFAKRHLGIGVTVSIHLLCPMSTSVENQA